MRTLDNFLKDVRKIFIVVRAVDASDVAIRHLIRFAGLLPSHPIWMCSVEVLGYSAGIHSRKHNQSISYRAGSRSVILVWPHRMVRRYHGVVVSSCAMKVLGTVAIKVAPIALCTNSRLFIIHIIQNASRISNCKFRLPASFDVTIMNVELRGLEFTVPQFG